MKLHPNKSRGPWVDFILFGSIITLTAFIIFIVLSTEKFDFQKTKASGADQTAQTNTVTTSDSTFPGIQIATDISNTLDTPYTIKYPQTDNEVFNDTIITHVTNAKNKYLAEVEINKENQDTATAEPNKLNIELEISPYKENYYSFILTKIHYKGAKQQTSKKTYFYNLVSGEILSLSDILNHDENNLTTLSKHIRSQLEQDPKLVNQLITEQLQTATKPIWTNFQKFSLNDESLVIYFDENEIANSSLTLPISLSFINPILASDFQIKMENIPTILSAPENKNSSNAKHVALTFDDGPHPDVTTQILNILDQYHAKATFFMLGNRVQHYPEIAQDVLAHGHEIGNHTWGHPVLTKMTAEQISLEYTKTDQTIFNAIGHYPTAFRPPYGATNDFVASQIPMPVTLWTVDTLDWKYRNAQQLLNITNSTIHNNAIILMHDIHQSTADGLSPLLAQLQEQGYEFVTVSELAQYK